MQDQDKLGAILYIYFGFGWGYAERSVLSDLKLAKRSGNRPILLCSAFSELGKEAVNHEFEVIEMEGRALYWSKLRKIGQLISSEEVRVVHCYQLNVLWPMAFYLRRLAHIPLFISYGLCPRLRRKNIWRKLLVSRIDKVFINSDVLIAEATLEINVPPRKYEILGRGESFSNTIIPPRQNSNAPWSLGFEYTGSHQNILALGNLLTALKILKSTYLFSLNISLEGPGQNLRVLKDTIWEHDLGDIASFKVDKPINELLDSIDVWIDGGQSLGMGDYSFLALSKGRPVLVPRKGEALQYLQQYGKILETYKDGDARELRQKLAQMLENYSSFTQMLEKSLKKIKTGQGGRFYREKIFSQYRQAIKKRKRLMGIKVINN